MSDGCPKFRDAGGGLRVRCDREIKDEGLCARHLAAKRRWERERRQRDADRQVREALRNERGTTGRTSDG